MSRLNEIGALATCVPLMLEAGYSARSLADFDDVHAALFSTWERLPPLPEVMNIAVDLQRRLFAAGKGRSAGTFDVLVAAHAIAHSSDDGPSVMVIHYDEDYDHLASVAPELQTAWIVPRGSIS
jgi:predicted nucleic acid-binding protein